MRWNDKAGWVRSRKQTHAPLITQERWDAVEAFFAARQRAPLARTPIAGRHYILAGLGRCGACRREGPTDRGNHPPTVYLREAAILPDVDWVAALRRRSHRRHRGVEISAARKASGSPRNGGTGAFVVFGNAIVGVAIERLSPDGRLGGSGRGSDAVAFCSLPHSCGSRVEAALMPGALRRRRRCQCTGSSLR